MTDPADKIIPLYEEHASVWHENRSRGQMAGERDWIIRFLDLVPEGGHVLDLGCGSGVPIGRQIIEAGYQVTGVDSAPSLIGLCQQNVPEGDWRVADMRTLNLGRRFDGLIAWHSFFHLSEAAQMEMFAIFAAHANKDAPLMFTSGVTRGETLGEWQGEPLFHASLDTKEYAALLSQHGFEVVEHVVDDAATGHANIWLAQYRG